MDFIGNQIYLYDFENYLLTIGRDELEPNSQYEIGAKMFAYLDYRYDDFFLSHMLILLFRYFVYNKETEVVSRNK